MLSIMLRATMMNMNVSRRWQKCLLFIDSAGSVPKLTKCMPLVLLAARMARDSFSSEAMIDLLRSNSESRRSCKNDVNCTRQTVARHYRLAENHLWLALCKLVLSMSQME